MDRHFHVVVESCKEGIRKPDQAAFKIACERLKTDPHEVFLHKVQKWFRKIVLIQVIFLDDLGVNVKAARRMGMHTILVRDIATALKQLSEATGIDVHSENENLKAKI